MSLTEDAPKVRRPRGLRFFYQDIVIVAERFRREATDKNTGVIDEKLWVTKVAQYFDENRQIFNADVAAREAVGQVKKRHNSLHRERIKLGEIYVPMILVPIASHKLVKMKDLSAPLLVGWHDVEEGARRGAKKILDAIDIKDNFRTVNLGAMAQNPDLKILHEVQLHVFGYVPKPDDDKEIDPTSAEAESASEAESDE